MLSDEFSALDPDSNNGQLQDELWWDSEDTSPSPRANELDPLDSDLEMDEPADEPELGSIPVHVADFDHAFFRVPEVVQQLRDRLHADYHLPPVPPTEPPYKEPLSPSEIISLKHYIVMNAGQPRVIQARGRGNPQLSTRVGWGQKPGGLTGTGQSRQTPRRASMLDGAAWALLTTTTTPSDSPLPFCKGCGLTPVHQRRRKGKREQGETRERETHKPPCTTTRCHGLSSTLAVAFPPPPTTHQVHECCHVTATRRCAQTKRLHTRSLSPWADGCATSPARDVHDLALPATPSRGAPAPAHESMSHDLAPLTSRPAAPAHDDDDPAPHYIFPRRPYSPTTAPNHPPRRPAVLVHPTTAPHRPHHPPHCPAPTVPTRAAAAVCVIRGTETLEGTHEAVLTRNPRLGYGLWGGSRLANPYPDPMQPYPPTPRLTLTEGMPKILKQWQIFQSYHFIVLSN
ncbi:hypothetical protein BJ912DRAFT_934135 [Pholiota molesta]|nr:hypothetical protein BJ912DRAFT_934135 [Pholiota molesta]